MERKTGDRDCIKEESGDCEDVAGLKVLAVQCPDGCENGTSCHVPDISQFRPHPHNHFLTGIPPLFLPQIDILNMQITKPHPSSMKAKRLGTELRFSILKAQHYS